MSDRDYFGDLGDSLEVSSTTHLTQRVYGYNCRDNPLLNQSGGSSCISGLLESYQTVDASIPGTSRPYQRLPSLVLQSSSPEHNRRFNLGYFAEFVNFDRKDSVTGTRIDLNPYVTFPIRSAGWYLTPKARLRYTTNSLDGVAAGNEDSPYRLLPSFNVDSGMFFEKSLELFRHSYTHTIEPRIYYLAVPFDDQRDLPIFDTGEFTFNFAQLFREDRFSGADRMSDANQLTLALTNRLVQPTTGREILRASIGQIVYFRHRSVTTAVEGINDTRSTSDLVAELATQFGPVTVKAGTQWNSREAQSDKNVVTIRYKPDSERVLNLSYRFIRSTVEQTDASFRWPWDHHTSLVGRLNYSLSDNQVLETFGGVEYESCCWAVRAVGRRFLSNELGAYNNGVMLQFELKGLAGIGQKAEAFLERSIPGYRDNF